jgi:hypothetical protein
MKQKYYSLKKILAEKADYNIIIGERSNGKTYACLEHILTDYIMNGNEGAYIRRWRDDITGKRADTVFNSLVSNGYVTKITEGEFDSIIYSRGGWHLAKFDEKERKMKAEKNAFCYAFSLSDVEHDKSTSFPNVVNIVFDEFLTRRYYLPDEFILFMNVLSTIIRDRENVKIFMLGNTVNKYCPYFDEMGLKNIEQMEQGTIDVYSFGNNLKIAVEYCNETKSKKSNKYFAFDNPRLNMITHGKWEMAIYPHLPIGYKIKSDSIIFTFSIVFNNKIVGCDVVNQNDDIFLFIRPKTTDPKNGDLVYTLDYTPYMTVRKSFMYPIDRLDNKIKSFFTCNRVFYQSNEIGEIVHNYLLTCTKN